MKRWLLALFLGTAASLVAVAVGWFALPHVWSLRYVNPGRTALMIERGLGVDQAWVPLARISPWLREAVIVAEDGDFYRHYGLDWHEFQESLKRNLRRREWRRGFSTITMQLAKNLYLTSQKTVTRKLLQIAIAFKLEMALPKPRILELYLNVIEWGPGIYGAEAAAQYYFHQPAAALQASEAAFLAAILPNPRRWGHWPPGPYIRRRQQIILARMGGPS